MKSSELSNSLPRQKNCKTVDCLQSTQITRNNVRLNRIPCRAGLSRKAKRKDQVLSFASRNVYISLNQTQNTVKKNTKSYVSCKHKHASTIEFPADQACLGKQKIRRAVHRQQQVCTKLMMFYWVCNSLVNN